ncbi:MAG TPA: M48 family metalloprotease [Caulobacteraceae bacterium]
MSAAKRLRATIGVIAAAALLASPVAPAFAQQDQGISLVRDTEIEEILHTEADPIFRAAGLEVAKVQIHLIGDKELNAETGAGLNLFLNTGLILEAKTPNQLIGVIAHETGHMAGGHVARSGDMGRAALGPMLIGLGLGVLAAAAGAPDAAAGLVYSSTYFAAISALGFSRVQESAADQAAVTYLEKAGVSGQGLVDFFNNFRYQEVFDDEKKFPFFRDHPLTDDRIEALTVRVNQQPHAGAVDTPQAIAAFAIMQAKLRGFLDLPQQTLIDYPDTDMSFPARYARAIAYYKQTETDKAVSAIDTLIADQPRNPYLWELKGQVLFEAGRPKDAVDAHRRSVELKPDAPLLRINLGQSLLAVNDPKLTDEAVSNIDRALSLDPEDPLGWRLLSEAYDSKGEDGMARLAAAEQNFHLGQMRDAAVFALRARKLLTKGTPQWRRATDIVLSSKPTADDLKELAREG